MIGTIQEGRYRILRKIGEGGQGEVYLAEHLQLGRPEALKVLREHHSGDENFVSRFRREARATNRVQHPNIVGVYDFGRLPDGRYFLAMEYVDGEPLDRAIGGAPMPVGRALRIAAQLARALAHAHGLGVVHRDLKPANLILVEHRGQPDFVKVLDFGMAKMLESDEKPDLGRSLDGQMFGTAPYMAPEQFLERGADPRMDIYAAGCILVEMLTGRPPFAGGMVSQMEQHLRAPPPAPSLRMATAGIPPALDAIVLRCLAKRPDDRFPDAASLADALETLAAARAPAIATRRPHAPRPLDDFGGDTEKGRTDPGAPATAPTVEAGADETGEAAAALAVEIADALVDLGVADAAVVAGAAQVGDSRREADRLRAESIQLEAHAVRSEQSFREREAAFTFAIGDLSFDPEPGPDALAQIDALSVSLKKLAAEARDAAAQIEERALALAAHLDDANGARDDACRRLIAAAAAALDRFDDPRGAVLRRRLIAARSLLPV